MDKYDRDPWRDAETVPLWFFMAVVSAILIALLLLGGCVHVRQGDFEYWRLGNQQIGEALLTLPDGSELLLEAQKSTIPVLIVTPTGFQLGEAYKLGGE